MSLIELLHHYSCMLRGGYSREEAYKNLLDMFVDDNIINAIVHSVNNDGYWIREDGSTF